MNKSDDSAIVNVYQSENQTNQDIGQLHSTTDSGKPSSPDDTGFTSMSPKIVTPSPVIVEDEEESSLPPWLKAVSFWCSLHIINLYKMIEFGKSSD